MSETAPAAASDAEGSASRTRAPKAAGKGKERGLFARIGLFVRQVVAELKKVVRPTRSELITYTTVVLVFLVVVMIFVVALDYAFGMLAGWVFG